MKKSFLLIISIMILTGTLSAQWTFSYLPGYGTYQMKSLSEYQHKHLDNCGLPAKILVQFPGYLNHQILIGKTVRGTTRSLQLGYLTTSGRTSYADYSGKWNYDLVNKCYQLGINLSFRGGRINNWKIRPYLNLATSTSLLQIEEELIIGAEELYLSQRFYALGVSAQPGLSIRYSSGRFEPGLFLGYELHTSLNFSKGDHNELLLGYSDTELVHPSWTGFRTGVMISYSLE